MSWLMSKDWPLPSICWGMNSPLRLAARLKLLGSPKIQSGWWLQPSEKYESQLG